MIFIIISILIFLILLFIPKVETNNGYANSKYKISVLISVKYHVEFLKNCLESFQKSNFKYQNLEFIIGDDTEIHFLEEFLGEFNLNFPYSIKIIPILEKIDSFGPKGSVLQQISRYATGDLYYFTDADCEISPSTLQNLSNEFDEKIGIVASSTQINGIRFFDHYQNMDFLWNHFLNFLVGKIQKPISIMGTNYMVSKSCFEELNGFENLEFTLIEDFSFLQKLKKQTKWKMKVLFSNDSTVSTFPQISWQSFVNQRLRWMESFTGIAFSYKVLMGLLFFADCSVLFLMFKWNYTSYIGVLFWVFQFLILRVNFKKKINWGHFLLYKLLNPFITLLLLGYKTVKPHKNTW